MQEKINIAVGGLSGTATSTYAMIVGWIHVPHWLYALIMAFLAGIAGAFGAYVFNAVKMAVKSWYKKSKNS